MKKLLILFVLMLSMLDANIDEAIKVYYAKDFKKALPIFEQLQKEGNIESNYYLGNMYQFGNGVKKNDKKAFKYYSIAASTDNKKRLKSIFNISNMYAVGQGVKKDDKKAFNLLKILDNEDIGVAQCLMGIMYTNGYGVKENYKKAILYFEKGCNSKKIYPKACYYAGDYYEKGIAVNKSYSTAKKYYKKGCDLGVKESCEANKNLKEPRPFYRKYQSPMSVVILLLVWWRMHSFKKKKKAEA